VTVTSNEDQYTFFNISRSFLLRKRYVSDQILEKIKIHILYSTAFFFENRAVYEKCRSRQAAEDNMAHEH